MAPVWNGRERRRGRPTDEIRERLKAVRLEWDARQPGPAESQKQGRQRARIAEVPDQHQELRPKPIRKKP
jgi:hypothetical protein